jgi:hypothetical protein
MIPVKVAELSTMSTFKWRTVKHSLGGLSSRPSEGKLWNGDKLSPHFALLLSEIPGSCSERKKAAEKNE